MSKRITVQDKILDAVESLKAIAKGDGTTTDIAKILLTINESETEWDGIIGYEEIKTAIYALHREACVDRGNGNWKEAFEKDNTAAELQTRLNNVNYS